ncbi:hypothetical protein Q1695_003782 [Nippostrongylus brasiliensis]|nr:hypothetical protein Q1695_003782 [Nippostrongylus brasiliensis]
MVTSNFLVLLIAFLNSDGALPAEKGLRCEYHGWPPFCGFMEIIHKYDEMARNLMTEAIFKDDKERVSSAIREIYKVLMEKEKSRVLVALEIALERQTNALFQLKVGALPAEKELACI